MAATPATLRAAIASTDTPAVAVLVDDRVSDDELRRLREEGLDVAELRIDRFSSPHVDDVVAAVQRFADVPTIATIRTAADGGSWVGDDEARAALFRAVLPHVGGIDVELEAIDALTAVVDAARAEDRVLIVSHHDFEGTPPSGELLAMATEARDRGAELVKLAVTATTQHDLRQLAAFTIEHAGLDLVTIAMGPAGAASRIFFPALGSRLTYTSTEPVAGQLGFAETVSLVRRFYPGGRVLG